METHTQNSRRQSPANVLDHGEGIEHDLEVRGSSESHRGLLTSTGNLSTITDSPPSQLSFINGLALVLGLQIGSGIFSAPSQVSAHVLSPFEGVLIWLLVGLLAWTGACSFIELGLAIPRNGGIQEYLQECYGDFMGCLFTWTWILLVKPSANALIATVLADYLCRGAIGYDEAPIWLAKLVGVLAVVLVAVVNAAGKKMGASAANWFMGIKLAIVISIVAIGLSTCLKNGEGISSASGWFGKQSSKPYNVWNRFGDLATALFGALFCYGGWESIGFVVGDMNNPAKSLPRVLHSSMAITVGSFIGLVVALYLCIPMDIIRGHTTLAAVFGERLFGTPGRITYSVAIVLSTLGALNTNIFANAKLCVTASQRGYLPAVLASLHFEPGEDELGYYSKQLKSWPEFAKYPMVRFARATKYLRIEKNVPIYAILLNAVMAIALIAMGTFDSLLVLVGLSEYFFFFFCVMGVFIIRSRNTELRKIRDIEASTPSYRTWTINPAVFLLLSGAFVLRGVIANALQGLALGGVILAGWIIFRWKFAGHLSTRRTFN